MLDLTFFGQYRDYNHKYLFSVFNITALGEFVLQKFPSIYSGSMIRGI